MPGLKTLERAAGLRRPDVAFDVVDDIFAAAGLPTDRDDPAFVAATEHLLTHLRRYGDPQLARWRACLPIPTAVSGQAVDKGATLTTSADEPQPPRTGPPTTASASTGRETSDHDRWASIRERGRPAIASGYTSTAVFEHWAAERPPEDKKLLDEWRFAVDRFVELLGDRSVAEITAEMVRVYRGATPAPRRASDQCMTPASLQTTTEL